MGQSIVKRPKEKINSPIHKSTGVHVKQSANQAGITLAWESSAENSGLNVWTRRIPGERVGAKLQYGLNMAPPVIKVLNKPPQRLRRVGCNVKNTKLVK
jgi:hypothetical protein